MVVMPADHVIRPAEKFQAAIRQAAALVDESPGRIVTFGIKPTYPAEIFGYIHRGKAIESGAGTPRLAPAVYVVNSFKEKPNAATAQKYVASGEYYWNSGIFVWRAATILDALRKRQPEMLGHLETIVAAWDTPERDAVFDREFAAIKGISIDYAVMEHATDVAVIEAPFEWDDLGGWQSLGAARRHRRPRQHDHRPPPGPQHHGHDRPHRRRAPGGHARPEGLHRRPHAERHARGQQARRRKDPADRQRTRIAGLDRLPVTGHESIRIAGIDYGTVRIGIALADTGSRHRRPVRELQPPHAGPRRGVLPAARQRKNRSAASSSACRCISAAARARSRPRPARSASGSAT